jgi:exodeoxyribonuclease VII large subunit
LLSDLGWSVRQEQNALARLSPRYAINAYRQRLDEISSRLERSVQTSLERKKLQLTHLQQSLRSLSPRAVLNRGYAIVTRVSDGVLIKQANQVNPNDDVRIQVSQGRLDARILKITQENEHER